MLFCSLKDINLSIRQNSLVPYIFISKSLFIKYKDIFIPINNNIMDIPIIRYFFFIFEYFIEDISIIRQNMIAPVSGSKNVKILGIIVNIIRSIMFLFL